MKNIIVLLGLIGFSYSMTAQSITIQGKIVSKEQIPLINATIELQNEAKQATISGIDGDFKLNLEEVQEEYRLIVRRLGYITLDTILKTEQKKIYVTIEMEQKVYEQPTVEITANQFNVFQYSDWNILDYNFQDKYLMILSIKGRNRKIGIYTLKGFRIHELEIKEKYDQIFLSCSGKIHLVGEITCTELAIVEEKIIKVETYKRNLFDGYIQPCILKVKDELIFKKMTLHNKRVQYFKYPKPNEPVMIRRIEDRKAAKVAQTYYNQIISMYYQAVANPNENAIDKGFKRINIIEEGEWSGKLFDLILSNEIQGAVAYYENVEAQPIAVKEFKYDDFFFVLDIVGRRLLKIDVENIETMRWKIDGYDWTKKSEILQDKITESVYLLMDDDILFLMDFKENGVELIETKRINTTNDLIKNIKIHQNTLFYCELNRTNYKMKLHKLSL